MYAAPIGTCSDCGKLCFASRKKARQYMNQRFPQAKMSVYRCGAYFHFGHTPWAVKRGVVGRDEWTPQQKGKGRKR